MLLVLLVVNNVVVPIFDEERVVKRDRHQQPQPHMISTESSSLSSSLSSYMAPPQVKRRFTGPGAAQGAVDDDNEFPVQPVVRPVAVRPVAVRVNRPPGGLQVPPSTTALAASQQHVVFDGVVQVSHMILQPYEKILFLL